MFGFFKKYDAHLCSAVSGRIVDNGKPVVGVKVERILIDFDSKKREDSTFTDTNGDFTLPAVNIRSRSPGSLFRELLTSQEIYIEHKGVFFTLWSATLWGVEPIDAYDRKLSQLNADLEKANVFLLLKTLKYPTYHIEHVVFAVGILILKYNISLKIN